MNEEIKVRVNPCCVISKNTYGDYAVHDIQTNASWNDNPYKDYVIVPDEMVTDILATKGFCDITLNDEETEVVSFVAKEIPEIPEPIPEPTQEERIAELEAQNADSIEIEADLMYELSLMQLGLL